MGLDITVTKIDSFAKKRECEARYKALLEEFIESKCLNIADEKSWRENMSPVEVDRFEEKLLDIRNECNVDEYGTYDYPDEVIEFSESPHPDHLFKMDYYRSAYNSSGFNSVADTHGIPNLYDIFGDPDGYDYQPDWEVALYRAREAVEKWRALEESPDAYFTVIEVTDLDSYIKTNPGLTEKTSIAKIVKTMEKTTFDGTWLGKEGVTSTLKYIFHGLFIGTVKNYAGRDVSAAHVILKSANNENQITWYREAAEVVLASITEIANHPEREGFYLRWSS